MSSNLACRHRLSTITHADQIIVLNNGTIAEKGTHEELVNANGRYASMWERQVQAERAAEKARAASRKAQKLLRKANIGGLKKQTDGHSDGYTSLDSSTILPGSSGNNSKAGTTGDSSSSSSSDAESVHSAHHDSDHSDHSDHSHHSDRSHHSDDSHHSRRH